MTQNPPWILKNPPKILKNPSPMKTSNWLHCMNGRHLRRPRRPRRSRLIYRSYFNDADLGAASSKWKNTKSPSSPPIHKSIFFSQNSNINNRLRHHRYANANNRFEYIENAIFNVLNMIWYNRNAIQLDAGRWRSIKWPHQKQRHRRRPLQLSSWT